MISEVVFFHEAGPMHDDGTHEEPEGWYFWHEDWCNYSGPFETKEKAEAEAITYAKTL